MPLYRITVNTTFYVQAEDEPYPEDYIGQVVADGNYADDVTKITEKNASKFLPVDGWDEIDQIYGESMTLGEAIGLNGLPPMKELKAAHLAKLLKSK